MDEETARDLVASHLKVRGQRPILQKGPGPDILLDGTALEVKGSKFDRGDALKQFIRYAFAYRDLEVALPPDAVELKLLAQLKALEALIRFRDVPRERQIRVYILDADESGTGRVFEFSSVKALSEFVSSQIEAEVSSATQGGDEVIEEVQAVLLDIDSRVVKAIQRHVRTLGMPVGQQQ